MSVHKLDLVYVCEVYHVRLRTYQDGLQLMALGNGPKQDCACCAILTPQQLGVVRFYLGTWLHRRGVYPSHIESQWSRVVAWNRCISVNAGQAV